VQKRGRTLTVVILFFYESNKTNLALGQSCNSRREQQHGNGGSTSEPSTLKRLYSFFQKIRIAYFGLDFYLKRVYN